MGKERAGSLGEVNPHPPARAIHNSLGVPAGVGYTHTVMMHSFPIRLSLAVGLAVLATLSSPARSQDLLKDGTLDSFRPVKGWRGVAEVSAVPNETAFQIGGEGRIIVNGSTRKERAPYLVTKEEHGDVRVELEFMIPKGSNAGVYLMGRYEVQILDSFGKTKTLHGGDMGGIYQRWDETRPNGKGFGGVPPKVNASKAPGEWQTFEITFRAPKFDEAGKKVSDATFEKVLVNGHLVQENASTTGPTRSSPLQGEAPKGPIAIQGDHGPIAIRRFRVSPIDGNDEEARLAELDSYWAKVSRAVNKGDFKAYAATCHEEGILVSGNKKTSHPLAQALARWKQEFDDTKAGKVKSSVVFRFSQRLGDRTTAHETGIFLYTAQKPGEAPKQEYIHFEGLLTKTPDGWKILMEYQKSSATEAEWKALKSPSQP